MLLRIFELYCLIIVFINLNAAVTSVPAYNFLIILGDFNCRLGADVTQHFFHEETNHGGELCQIKVTSADDKTEGVAHSL
jgi:hypothetical protein